MRGRVTPRATSTPAIPETRRRDGIEDESEPFQAAKTEPFLRRSERNIAICVRPSMSSGKGTVSPRNDLPWMSRVWSSRAGVPSRERKSQFCVLEIGSAHGDLPVVQERDFKAAETTEFRDQCGVEREIQRRSKRSAQAPGADKPRPGEACRQAFRPSLPEGRGDSSASENELLIDRQLCGSFGGKGIGNRPAIGRNEPNE